MNIKRGDIYLVVLDPVVGREISKTRPAVVVSNDIGNRYSGTVTIVPVTSKHLEKIYPFEVYLPRQITALKKNSKAKADQIRTLDKARLLKPLGCLNRELIGELDNALRVHLKLD
jgi:mRNA interferase MazF